MILYLHGFRSSPTSFKARMVAAALAARGQSHLWDCPQLPTSPRQAIALALRIAQQSIKTTASARDLTVLGSSLGGYYATWIAEQLGCKAVLLNPAVAPARDLADKVGPQHRYHSNLPYVFLPAYIADLTTMYAAAITQKERYFLIAATGNEVLDWREMCARYRGCRQRIVPGSNHALSDFSQYLPEVLDFAFSTTH
jgi:predicted esterase YcpF (UPF0227 family)